ncbi:MAG: imelysin family protein [Bacteroidota bacterium]
MLENIFTAGILSSHSAFTLECRQLDSTSALFVAAPSLETLSALQAQWVQTKQAWKACQLYNIGVARENFLHNKIDKWPANPRLLGNNLKGTAELNEAFVEGSGSTSKGLPAIEYFIYSSTELEDFTSNPLSERRKAYIKALTENLFVRAENLENTWKENQPDFINGTENFSKGSVNELVNAQVALLERILTEKLGKPLGKTRADQIDPSKVEAYQSGISLSLIEANLISFKTGFQGDPSKPGFDDLLDAEGAKVDDGLLSEAILTQVDLCIQKVRTIEDPLKIRVADQRESLDELYGMIIDLLFLVKVDMANNLGILITFNDTDGD